MHRRYCVKFYTEKYILRVGMMQQTVVNYKDLTYEERRELREQAKVRREEFMKKLVPAKERCHKYTTSDMKKNPIEVIKYIEKTFCDSLLEQDQQVVVKDAEKFGDSVALLQLFAFEMGWFGRKN